MSAIARMVAVMPQLASSAWADLTFCALLLHFIDAERTAANRCFSAIERSGGNCITPRCAPVPEPL